MQRGQENQIVQFLLHDGKVKGALLNATELVKSAVELHQLGAVETLILGQALIAGALLTTTIKGKDRVNLSLECGGAIGGWSVDYNAQGDVRGSLSVNPIRWDEEKPLTLDNLYGPGFLHVSRILEGSQKPFTGSVELAYPDLASNLAYYYLTSEQTPSAFLFSVEINRDGEFQGAAGLFLQVLPGADESLLEKLNTQIHSISSLYQSIKQKGNDGALWLEEFFSSDDQADEKLSVPSFNLKMVGLKSTRFFCPCSQSQIEFFVKSFSKEKIENLMEEEDGKKILKVKCHGCSCEYFFTQPQIEELFDSLKEKSC